MVRALVRRLCQACQSYASCSQSGTVEFYHEAAPGYHLGDLHLRRTVLGSKFRGLTSSGKGDPHNLLRGALRKTLSREGKAVEGCLDKRAKRLTFAAVSTLSLGHTGVDSRPPFQIAPQATSDLPRVDAGNSAAVRESAELRGSSVHEKGSNNIQHVDSLPHHPGEISESSTPPAARTGSSSEAGASGIQGGDGPQLRQESTHLNESMDANCSTLFDFTPEGRVAASFWKEAAAVAKQMYEAVQRGDHAKGRRLFEPYRGKPLGKVLGVTHMYDAALLSAAKRGAEGEARGLLAEMRQLGFQNIGYMAHGAVIQAICNAGKAKEAVEFLQREVPPDAQCTSLYNTLLKGLLRLKATAAAQEVLNAIEPAGLAWDVYTWRLALCVKRRQSDGQGLLELWQRLQGTPLNQDLGLHATYVNSLARVGPGQAAVAALRDFLWAYGARARPPPLAEGAGPHPLLWSSVGPSGAETAAARGACRQVLRAAARRGDLEAVRGLLRDMEQAGLGEEARAQELLLSSDRLVRGSASELRAALREAAGPGVPLDRGAYMALVRARVQQGDARGAAKIFQRMLNSGLTTSDIKHYNALFEALAKTGDLQGMQVLYRRVVKTGISPDICTYIALFEAVRRRGELMRRADMFEVDQRKRTSNEWRHKLGRGVMQESLVRWVRDMRRNRIPHQQASITTLVLAYGQVGLVQPVHWLLTGGAERDGGATPSMRAYNAGIAACCRYGHVDRAEELLTRMELLGLKPDAYSYVPLISGYGNVQKLDEARRVLVRMQEAGIKPGTHAYNALMSADCQADRTDDAIGVLEAMQRQGVPPDDATWTRLLMAGYRARRGDAVAAVLGHMGPEERREAAWFESWARKVLGTEAGKHLGYGFESSDDEEEEEEPEGAAEEEEKPPEEGPGYDSDDDDILGF